MVLISVRSIPIRGFGGRVADVALSGLLENALYLIRSLLVLKQRLDRRLETRRFLGRRPEFLAACRIIVLKVSRFKKNACQEFAISTHVEPNG